MDTAGIPFSPVNTPSDLFSDPQMLAHALSVRMPNGVMANLPPLALAIDDETPGIRMQPPAAGEHTDAVLAEAGYAPGADRRAARGGGG